MNEEMINHVLSRMSDHLDNSQMIKLRNTLEESLQNEERAPDKSSAELLDQFIATKRLDMPLMIRTRLTGSREPG